MHIFYSVDANGISVKKILQRNTCIQQGAGRSGVQFLYIKSQIGKTDIERARCAVGTPLHFKKFLERQRTSRILEDSIFIFLSHEYYFKIFKTFPASAFNQGHSTKFSSIQQPYCKIEWNKTPDIAPSLARRDHRKSKFGLCHAIKLI